MQNNPLKQYFRQPAIYIKLPSHGKGYPANALIEEASGEYGVLPMTAMDEITYRTPDALFNGSAVVSVIQSCMPNIKDAWSMPSTDIDVVLIAIRIASYGHELDISTKCPQCATQADYAVDLRTALENIEATRYHQPLEIGDLKIVFKPMTYRQINENNMAQFEDQKMLSQIDSLDGDQAKAQQLGDILRRITAMTTQALANNIRSVHTPDAQVSEANFIFEWLQNCDVTLFARIRDHILQIKQQSEIKPARLRCTNCQHEYEQTYTLDMSNFFGGAS